MLWLLGVQDVDKVELIYTKFVSLISSEPTIQTLLPLTPQVCLWGKGAGSRVLTSSEPTLLPLSPQAHLLVLMHLLVCIRASNRKVYFPATRAPACTSDVSERLCWNLRLPRVRVVAPKVMCTAQRGLRGVCCRSDIRGQDKAAESV